MMIVSCLDCFMEKADVLRFILQNTGADGRTHTTPPHPSASDKRQKVSSGLISPLELV